MSLLLVVWIVILLIIIIICFIMFDIGKVQLRFLQFFESLLVWIFAYKCSESWLANGDTWPQCHHLLSDREVVQQYWNQFITKDNWTKFLSLRLHACAPVFKILDALVDRPLYLASYTTMHAWYECNITTKNIRVSNCN